MVDCGTSLSETVPRSRRQRGEYGGITGLSMSSQCMRFSLHCMIWGSELEPVKTCWGYTSSLCLKTNRYSHMGLAPQRDTARYRVRFFWVTNERAQEPRMVENYLLNNEKGPGKPGLLYSDQGRAKRIQIDARFVCLPGGCMWGLRRNCNEKPSPPRSEVRVAACRRVVTAMRWRRL